MSEFSIKSKSQWLWRTGHTLETIRQALQNRTISTDWLVCPLGEADRAITIGEFLHAPENLKPTKLKLPRDYSKDWQCLKCGHTSATQSKIVTNRSLLAHVAFGGFPTTHLTTLTCEDCRFTEFYSD